MTESPHPQSHPTAEPDAEQEPAPAAKRGALPPESEDATLRARARRALLKYGLARLALFLVLTVVIAVVAWLVHSPVPLMMSALLALFVAFPLSMLVFTNLRLEANRALALSHQRRKQRKEWVQEELAQR